MVGVPRRKPPPCTLKNTTSDSSILCLMLPSSRPLTSSPIQQPFHSKFHVTFLIQGLCSFLARVTSFNIKRAAGAGIAKTFRNTLMVVDGGILRRAFRIPSMMMMMRKRSERKRNKGLEAHPTNINNGPLNSNVCGLVLRWFPSHTIPRTVWCYLLFHFPSSKYQSAQHITNEFILLLQCRYVYNFLSVS